MNASKFFAILSLAFLISFPSLGRYRVSKPAEVMEKSEEEVPDTLPVRTLPQLLSELQPDEDAPNMFLFGFPKTFRGYREPLPPPSFAAPELKPSPAQFRVNAERVPSERTDSLMSDSIPTLIDERSQEALKAFINGDVVPEWLARSSESFRRQGDMLYMEMINNPSQGYYLYWELPQPPSMPAEDYSYRAFLKKMNLFLDPNEVEVEETPVEKRHWLHVVNVAVQFSQAYLSKNWYQGGNNYLSLLGNFLWDVQLNQVYHPNMMFQSTLSYKLGLNSTEDNQLHRYSISEDLFQYNIKFGYKAAHHWYYSFTGQFKTQFLNNYPSDSMVRTASFLTPGVLTLGLGMTYTKQNAKKTINFNASISPLSYNLKTAIDRNVDHLQFGMAQDAHTLHEFGSTAELTFNWRMADQVLYKTRLFLFTDYKESNADWQNTFEFQFSRFFSTQLYLNLRYDSTADIALAPKWKRWMLKEILSVGLSYTFSTKI